MTIACCRNFFDTANVYAGGASEEVLGRFLKANTHREAVVIATKLHGVMARRTNGRGLSRKSIFYELDQSLRRLGTDYVDLYQIHRWDYETPIEETLEALHDLVKSGKVRYIGASSMLRGSSPRRSILPTFTDGPALSPCRITTICSIAKKSARYGPCRSEDIGVIPWSPLARGRLTRPWQSETTKRYETDQIGRGCTCRRKMPTAKLWSNWERLRTTWRSPRPACAGLAAEQAGGQRTDCRSH